MASKARACVVALRTLSTAAAVSPSPSSSSASSLRKKKKNLVDVLRFLPNWGVGAKVTKKHWQPDTYYRLTKIRLGKDAKHGAAWGIYHESGSPQTGGEEKIGGVNKKIWRYISEVEGCSSTVESQAQLP